MNALKVKQTRTKAYYNVREQVADFINAEIDYHTEEQTESEICGKVGALVIETKLAVWGGLDDVFKLQPNGQSAD